jgi:hypothetical protein
MTTTPLTPAEPKRSFARRKSARAVSGFGILVIVATLAACSGRAVAERDAAAQRPGGSAWPTGSTDERIESLADHIGGFSRAMMEVGYRYNELFFAGTERNWELAEYHAAKIGDAIEQGIERRPGRRPSAEIFLERELGALLDAIGARDPAAFERDYLRLTEGCNACHLREDVQFIVIRQPDRRIYPWATP